MKTNDVQYNALTYNCHRITLFFLVFLVISNSLYKNFLYVRYEFDTMPKWKKDAIEFTVSINYNESRVYQSLISKPIIDALGVLSL